MKPASAAVLALTGLAAVAAAAVTWLSPASQGPLCGQTSAVQPAIRHIIIVMLENRSYSQVVGRPAAPYQTHLARECGSATEAFGTTHGSARILMPLRTQVLG